MILLHTQLTVYEYLKGLSHCIQDNQTGIESKLMKNPPNTYRQELLSKGSGTMSEFLIS